MKVRVIGPTDLVRIWAAKLTRDGFVGREYPARSPAELRWYGDLDDRRAEEVADGGRQLVLPNVDGAAMCQCGHVATKHQSAQCYGFVKVDAGKRRRCPCTGFIRPVG